MSSQIYSISCYCVVRIGSTDYALVPLVSGLRSSLSLLDREMELLVMPKNSGNLPLVQWPLFLLASKVIQLL